jgi:hypothetical protein
MTNKRSASPSPESIARADRQRIAFEEGLKAMADIEQEAVEVRTNMARLRALREANESKTRAMEPTTSLQKEKKKKRTRPVD